MGQDSEGRLRSLIRKVTERGMARMLLSLDALIARCGGWMDDAASVKTNASPMSMTHVVILTIVPTRFPVPGLPRGADHAGLAVPVDRVRQAGGR